MGFDFDVLLTEINLAYGLLKNSCSDIFVTGRFDVGSSKSTTDAIRLRSEGNEKYKEGLDLEALTLYTKSVASSGDDSEELVLAYGNRSAVLYRLKNYEACLSDINRALMGRYPKNLEKKLLDRKIRCQSIVEGMQQSTVEIDEWVDLCNFGNSLLPSTSSKVKLECDENWGRFMVAVDDIGPGEILSSEEFFLLMLKSEGQYKNCSHCLSKCDALVPCFSCNQMMYCSETCRTQAHNLYHRIECKLILFYKRERLDPHEVMAIRALLIGTEQGAALKSLMKKVAIRDIFKENIDPRNKLFVNDYQSVLRLSWKLDDPSRMRPSIWLAVQMVVVLQRLEFFMNDSECRNDKLSNQLNEEQLFATALLINHISSLRMNKFAVNQMISSDLLGQSSCEIAIGSGVCRLHNLVNHSCNPNTHSFVRNREHILFTVRPIKRGEQIFISYCHSFANHPKAKRETILSDFEFTCFCEACVNNWPVFAELQNRKTEIIRKDTIRDLFKTTVSFFNEGSIKLHKTELLRIIIKHIEWLYRTIKTPSAHIVKCEDLLIKFIMLSYGDFYREYMDAVRREYVVEKTLTVIRYRIMLETK